LEEQQEKLGALGPDGKPIKKKIAKENIFTLQNFSIPDFNNANAMLGQQQRKLQAKLKSELRHDEVYCFSN